MLTIQYATSLNGNGGTIGAAVSRTADGGGSREVTLPAGKAGTLSTRTDNDTGILTVGSGHGILDTDTVDVYWNGGMRYGVDVTGVTATTISIDAGSGTNLPIATTAIVVCKQVQINADIDGDALVILGMMAAFAALNSTSKCHADFQDSAGDSIEAVDLNANQPKAYDITGGDTNVFTGDPITKVMASNGSSSADATLKLMWLADSTP